MDYRVPASEAKQRFGQIMEASQKYPVIIEKTGRPKAVLISIEEYQRFLGMEDRYWIEKAEESARSGFMGAEDSMTYLRKKLDESK